MTVARAAAAAPLATLTLAAAIGATPRLAAAQRTPADTSTPSATLLYQNFPNPFPSPVSRVTCIWFDLPVTTNVSLTIHDARGHLVRQLVPSPSVPGYLPAGRYGRGATPADGTCDPAFSWDGRAADGSTVPRGLYLIRLRTSGAETIKKALFRGP